MWSTVEQWQKVEFAQGSIYTYIEITENNKFASQLEHFLCQHKLFILAFKGVNDSWVTMASKRLDLMMGLTVMWDGLVKWEPPGLFREDLDLSTRYSSPKKFLCMLWLDWVLYCPFRCVSQSLLHQNSLWGLRQWAESIPVFCKHSEGFMDFTKSLWNILSTFCAKNLILLHKVWVWLCVSEFYVCFFCCFL